jgi:hypothetical protein
VDSWMQPSSWGFRAMETPTWSRPSHNTERLSRVQLATSLIATVLSTTNFSRGALKLCYFQLHLVALYYHKLTRCNCIRRSWSQPEFEFQMSQFLARRWSSHELPVWWPHSISIGHKKQGHLDLGPTAFSFCNREMLIRATTYIQKMQNFYEYDSWHNADMTTSKLCSSVLHELVHGWAISSCAQSVTLQKYFSHPSLVFFFFSTWPIKLKWVLQIGGRLLIATHLGNQGTTIRSYLLHSSMAGSTLCCAFYQPQQTLENCSAKTILLSQTGLFWLFLIQF